jgi:hypothetical protein
MLRFLILRYLPLPKVIGPKTHRMIDYLTIGAFLGLGAFWWSDRRKASVAALANALFVLGYVPFTDYDGDGHKPISLRTHCRLDRIEVGMAALAPRALGFENQPQSLPFRVHAFNQTAVINMTRVKELEAHNKARRKHAA